MALFDFLCYIKLVIYIPFLFSTLRTINLLGQFKFRFCHEKVLFLKCGCMLKRQSMHILKSCGLALVEDIRNFKLDLRFDRKTTHLVYIFHFCYWIFYLYKLFTSDA